MDLKNKAKWKKMGRGRNKFDKRKKFGDKQKKLDLIDHEIKELEGKYKEFQPSERDSFSAFPLSSKTKKGLKDASYTTPTEIQRESIGLALQGNDILGAAKTGSGKTLAFLLPVLECLFRLKWTPLDGLGALIISPTRELAYQIFEVLRKVGKYHDFSAGLVIGGKHLKEEAERINRTNIVICTPGRLLQHMDETVMFNADNLQILVLDEADRILDLGFQQTMNAVIQNLPPKRQTLLFSATQTKSVKDLARLSLKDPMYVSMHEHSQHSTPSQLTQSYVVCNLHRKLDMLWSFLRNHTNCKILVFMATCKQVRFVHESFRHLRPGITVLALHGAMQQLKRMSIYNQFCRKEKAVLFATDVAARGLDFPAVNWVIQLDCPEDANTYIHRAGRTARYEKDGEALLVLLPSEATAMSAQLEEKKIPINLIKVNPKKMGSIQGKLESLCASDVTLKEYAQRAFTSYLKSVFYMSNKKVFDVSKLDTEKFARSLGLAMAPRVRFLQKQQKLQEQKLPQKSSSDSSAATKPASTEEAMLEIANIFKRKAAQTILSESDEGITDSDENDSDGQSAEEDESGGEEDSESLRDESSDSVGDSAGDSAESDADVNDTKSAMLKTESSAAEGGEFRFQLDDDAGEELLKVKNVITPKVEDEEKTEEETDAKKPKTKVVTKYSIAKKLQKKNLKVNTKVVFNEKGEVVSDVHKQPQRTAPSGLDEEEESGGINIEQARKRLREEDQFDKQLYREKIKKKHREARLKEKEERRKAALRRQGIEDDEEPEAILANDGEGFNLDELPDPDKLYGSPGSAGEEEEGEEESGEGEESDEAGSQSDEENSLEEYSDDEDSEDDGPTAKKRKATTANNDFDTGLDLADDEALALKLLQS